MCIRDRKSDASIAKLYQNYLNIKTALAADNSDDASKAANTFIKSASMVDYKVLSEGNLNVLRKDASKIAESRSIETQRDSFNGLSKNMISLAKTFKLSGDSVFAVSYTHLDVYKRQIIGLSHKVIPANSPIIILIFILSNSLTFN